MMRLGSSVHRRSTSILILAGAVACLLSTVVTYLVGIGSTPAFIYGETSYWLTTFRSWRGVPIEFIGAAGFLGTFWVFAAATRRPTIWLFVLLSMSVLAGSGAYLSWLAWTTTRPCVPVLVGTALAFTLVLAAAIVEFPSAGTVAEDIRAAVRVFRQGSRFRSRTLVFGALVTLTAVLLQAQISGVTKSDANSRSFRRWFLAQAPVAALSMRNGIRVTIFTDYQCPACSHYVPMGEIVARNFQKARQYPIEVAIKDYPLDSTCNPQVKTRFHASACQAAVAVRLVGQEAGGEAAARMKTWLYEHFNSVTEELVLEQLASLRLDKLFRERFVKMLEAVRVDAVYGTSLGVRSTPTVFVDGVMLPSVEALQWALEAEAERLGLPAASR